MSLWYSRRESNSVVGECEMYKAEQDVSEMRKIHECDMTKFIARDNREKTIVFLGDRWWPQKMKQEGDLVSETFM